MSEYDDTYDDIVDIDTSDAIEPRAVSEGEYKLRITGFNKDNGKIVRKDRNGNRFFIVLFDIPNEEASKGISNFFGFPESDMDKKSANDRKWSLEVFKRAFGIEGNKIDDSIIGREGYAMLGLVDDPEYGEKNVIKKFLKGA